MIDRGRLLSVLSELAPLELAEDWDNVGVLVDPTPREIRRILLCIDFSEAVLDEALSAGVDWVVAYHPLIFSGLKRLSHSGPERVVVRSIEAGVTVYSPHTALDAVPGGVNDWLAESLGPGVARAIELKGESGDPLCGSGRLVTLEREVSFEDLVARVKKSLGLERIRVAKSPSGTVVRTVALCPGAGGSVICSEAADLYLTGEMRHHDVLAANARGTSVILGEHSNTERGYLGRFRELLLSRLGLDDDRVIVSQVDSDPISIA